MSLKQPACTPPAKTSQKSTETSQRHQDNLPAKAARPAGCMRPIPGGWRASGLSSFSDPDLELGSKDQSLRGLRSRKAETVNSDGENHIVRWEAWHLLKRSCETARLCSNGSKPARQQWLVVMSEGL